jgi:hypothetical protein
VWESPTSVLVWFDDLERRGSSDGLSYEGRVFRCDTSLRDCTRIQLPPQRHLTALSSRAGTDPPADDHPPR